MTFKKTFACVCLLAFTTAVCTAQNLTQTIRGIILDKVTQSPLPGATVILQNSNPIKGTQTDPLGAFRLSNVPVGRHTLKITFIGYKDIIVPEVIVNSGKETVISVPLEEEIVLMGVVTVQPEIEKNKPLNDLAVVSARTFSVEETRKYAAAVNDPARMVASYAGVVQTSDGNNSISIRGNSPFGLLWRMEGVDIPNPNHFAGTANSGGGISILSSQLLTNSDFITGAFPAEYGNALAGVFDLNLRKGNNEKQEYTVQAGFLGIDVAAEGPFSKKSRGSYLINYRYSTLSILSKLGVPVGEGATDFQDLSMNFSLPTRKAGTFSLFGFGGLSSQSSLAKKDSTLWHDDYDRYNTTYFSNTGAAGLRHSVTLSEKTYLQSAVVVSGNDHGYHQEKLDESYFPRFDFKLNYINTKVTASSVVNHKFNARHSIRSGVYFNRYYYDLHQTGLNHQTNQIEQKLNSAGTATTFQAFSQWNFRVTERLTMNAGVHALYLVDNSTSSIEPRGSIKYELNEKQWLSAGFGLHSQMQPVGVYVAEVTGSDGVVSQPNRNLRFNKAEHFVIGYDRSLTKYLHVKAETYYQRLYQIAVSADPASTLSVTNNEEGYITDPLVNKGSGRNYGLELTIEQFTHKDAYFLLSSSLYDSRYRALDGVLRNSRYNGNHAFSFTAGKEFHQAGPKGRIFGVNIRTLFSGGFRTTPIDYAASVAAGQTKYIESEAYSGKLPDYFRTDLRFSIKRNRSHMTTTLALDIQNVTNRKNVYGNYFDPQTGSIKTAYQLPLLPIISYRIEF